MTPDEEQGRAPGPSHAAFDACFEAHYSNVLAFALRRVDGRATAEDVLSETFAVAWRRRDAIPKPALPWLYGIAIRVIANEHRSSRRRARLRRKLAAEPPRSGRDTADVAGGFEPGEIAEGPGPGPNRELCVTDPDGHGHMVAELWKGSAGRHPTLE